MLYLKIFGEILIKNPLRSIGFFLSGFTLCFFLGQSERLQDNLMSNLPSMGEAPHFFALVDQKINPEGIRRKLMELPGIKAVRNISKNQIKTQLSEVIGNIGVDLPEDLIVPSLSGLKISFAPELEARSQRLIKKYLERLTGEDKVTLGPTIGSQKKTKDWINSFKSSLKLKVGGLLVGLAGLLYLVFGLSLGSELGKEAYLVERFSRRKNVVQVSAALGYLVSAAIILLPVVIFGKVNLVGVLIFASVSLIFFAVTAKRGWKTA
jgi:hypothetical protein